MSYPVIGITMGDGAGVGPEIIVKALVGKEVREKCVPLVIGDCNRLREAVRICEIDVEIEEVDDLQLVSMDPRRIFCLQVGSLPAGLEFGELSREAGRHAYLYIEKAVELAKENKIDAVCTAPLNKEALQMAGYSYPGHTEILADLTGTKDYSMMLAAPNLKVIHLTTHVGLKQAINSITPDRTYKVVRLAYDTLHAAGYRDPKIAVCGINPHAGENGLFGEGEEEAQLIPGIQKAKEEGIGVEGPYPADTLFFRAVRGDFDMVVACYHDQGHSPVKVLGLEAGVNITVGLNYGVVRTSVDHGTAFDIAGKNIADDRSLLAAIDTAVDLSPK
ncbi:4-hydroxythreonine-4-phosphate dehydrogenase [Salsuginibacillus halophilus]|uniref:4-hydroxythreonine-4-phosphate dehydrogenase n=1 Tax=Salsuginibacillus halophilus TaxID=517424 RepID=A0A2P8HHY0_9BACI|nr:4-hydroxythreonine-4-phosphate dehydrogenase PdxA [Salsuginibacillus halophilus]PSL45807.1 4-hydroxythreonine-4-phosphate dehydrogenase [Salsuginibacillus halophilus]